MHADLESIVCKFGGDRAICLREEAICAKVYRQTDDGRRAIALAHSWNELIKITVVYAIVAVLCMFIFRGESQKFRFLNVSFI